MNMNITTLLKSDYAPQSVQTILNNPPRVLLGVNTAANDALKSIGINTVFDLAVSETFAAAKKIDEAANNPKSAMFQFGRPSSDLVNPALAAGRPVEELAILDIALLARIPPAQAPALKDALVVRTVRDLANYPPYKSAVTILNSAYFPENIISSLVDDDEAINDLVPANGEYPIERVQYTTLVLDEIKTRTTPQSRVNVQGTAFTPIDLSTLAGGDGGFQDIAFGALLTINQSWYSQGVALGQLVHSLALAPGESTRIAVVDWTRTTTGTKTEDLQAQDSVSQSSTHRRAINEVTSAIAAEAQEGYSSNNVQSNAKQSGTSTATDLSSPAAGFFGGGDFAVATSNSNASSETHSDGYSTSTGSRNLTAELAQKVNDSTQQNAHVVRGQRSAVITEVSETEKEKVTTRVIANYNHMHALNIHYYEVVQLYKTKVQIARVQKVIFIPLKPMDFQDEALIRRFQGVLVRAAPTRDISETLNNLDIVELAPPPDTKYTRLGATMGSLVSSRGFGLDRALLDRLVFQRVPIRELELDRHISLTPLARATPAPPAAAPVAPPPPPPPQAPRLQMKLSVGDLRSVVRSNLWDTLQVSNLSNILSRPMFRPESGSLFLPADVFIVESSVTPGDNNLTEWFQLQSGQMVKDVNADNKLSIVTIGKILVRRDAVQNSVSAVVTLTLMRNGVVFPLTLPAVQMDANDTESTVVLFKSGGISASVKRHLSDNRSLYNTAIMRSLNPTQIAMLLSGYDIETSPGNLVPVAQVVDPTPIRYVGNYLAFTMSVDPTDPAWVKWQSSKQISLSAVSESLVPMATGGTFAEAILGRSNCAEKLDITRFWNWKDSPIPLQAPDIDPVKMGSRDGQPDLSSAGFGSPLINLMPPSSLPDPTGMAAVLSAIQNGNMFRDMSGLAGIIAANTAATQATQAGASSAGQQAGENMNNMLKAKTERQRIAAGMIESLASTAASMYTGGLAGGGKGGGGGGGTISDHGAKINYFDKTAAPAPVEAPPPAPPPTPVAPGAPTPATPAPKAPAPSKPSPKKVHTNNPAALNAVHGDTKSRSEVVDGVLASGLPETGPMVSASDRQMEIFIRYPDDRPMFANWAIRLYQKTNRRDTGTIQVGEALKLTPAATMVIDYKLVDGSPKFMLYCTGTISSEGPDKDKSITSQLDVSLEGNRWLERDINRIYLQPTLLPPIKTRGKDIKEMLETSEKEARLKIGGSGSTTDSGESTFAFTPWAAKVVGQVAATISGELSGGWKWGDSQKSVFENEQEMEIILLGGSLKVDRVE